MDPHDVPVVGRMGIAAPAVDEDAGGTVQPVFPVLIGKGAVSFQNDQEKKGIQIVSGTDMFF